MMVSAIVVARGGSKRLPNKALLPFGDTSLIGHKVKQLLAAMRVDRVYVGSDSSVILMEAAKAGAQVVQRSPYHCDESRCSANEMIADMASKVAGDVVLWAHPTNPLVRSDTYAAVIRAYFDGVKAKLHDSLCSVTTVRRHCWFEGRPHNFDPWGDRHQLAKDLPGYRFQNGAIFIQSRELMQDNRYFYGARPLLFEIDEDEASDIDEYLDYERAAKLAGVEYAPRV